MIETTDTIIRLKPDSIDRGQSRILKNYGVMKLGHNPTIKDYAQLLAKEIVSVVSTRMGTKKQFVASSPRGIVPSASNLLAMSVVSTQHAFSGSSDLRLLEIKRRRRDEELPRHYASLDVETRVEYLSRDCKHWYVCQDIRDSEVVLVDDVYVTGSQQRQLADFLRAHNVRGVHFLYLAGFSQTTGIQANTIETKLNLSGVASDDAFVKFIHAGNFTVTTRLLWRIMELPDGSFHDAIGGLTKLQLTEVLKGVLWEGRPSPIQRARLQFISATIDQLGA